MKNVILKEGESRQHYLLRVAAAFIEAHAEEQTMIWDGAECDGICLVDEINAVLDDEPENQEKIIELLVSDCDRLRRELDDKNGVIR